MRRLTDPRNLLIAAAAVIILVNIITLAGVAYNRSGETSQMLLDQRELALPSIWYSLEEDSGLHLRLQWRVEGLQHDAHGYSHHRQASWLDAAKLRSLGFSEAAISDDPSTSYRQPAQSRQRWLVLELDGPDRQRVLERVRAEWERVRAVRDADPDNPELQRQADAAELRWIEERDSHSRLFAIDAGRDPRVLRDQYPDPARFLIVRGKIVPGWIRPNPEQDATVVAGRIASLDVETIHVPLSLRDHFSGYLQDPRQRSDEPRQLMVAWGRRYEPWLITVSN